MMEHEIIVGLDIGTTKVCAIIGDPIDATITDADEYELRFKGTFESLLVAKETKAKHL